MPEWETLPTMPALAAGAKLNVIEEFVITSKLKKFEEFSRIKGKITTLILYSMSDSSILRIEQRHKTELENVIAAGDIEKMLELITKTHTLLDERASIGEREDARNAIYTFKYKTGETIGKN